MASNSRLALLAQASRAVCLVLGGDDAIMDQSRRRAWRRVRFQVDRLALGRSGSSGSGMLLACFGASGAGAGQAIRRLQLYLGGWNIDGCED